MPIRPSLSGSRNSRYPIVKLSNNIWQSSCRDSLLGVSGDCSTVPTKPRIGSMHRRCAFYIRTVNHNPKRSFSHTSRQEGFWDEDEEVAAPAPAPTRGPVRSDIRIGPRAAQPVRRARAPPAPKPPSPHRNVGSVLRSRVETKALANGRIFIEQELNSLPSHEFWVDNYLDLKYQHAEDFLSDSAAVIRKCDADSRMLTSAFENQINEVISEATSRVLQAGKTTQSCVAEYENLSKSLHMYWDSVIALQVDRLSKANTATQQCVDEWEDLSFSILSRLANVVSVNTERVLRAEKITEGYITEVARLSSSIIGLERLQTSIAESEKTIARIDHEFSSMVFAKTPTWAKKLEESSRAIAGLQLQVHKFKKKLIPTLVYRSATSVRELQRAIDFETSPLPMQRAKRRIDGIIRLLEKNELRYQDLKSKFNPAENETPWDITDLCSELSQCSSFGTKDRLRFAELGKGLEKSFSDARVASHHWRSRWRQKQISRSPEFLGSQPWTIGDITTEHSADKERAITEIVQGLDRIEESDIRKTSLALSNIYKPLKRGSSPRSPELHIYWRQLDVLAPIKSWEIETYRLSTDVMYLLFGLRGQLGELWTWMLPHEIASFRANIKSWNSQFTAHRRELQKEVQQFQLLNWLRLKSEGKLYAMNEPAYLAGKFEVLEPLSQNPDRFREWVDLIARDVQIAWINNAAINSEPALWESRYDLFESLQKNEPSTVESMLFEPGSSSLSTLRPESETPVVNRTIPEDALVIHRPTLSWFTVATDSYVAKFRPVDVRSPSITAKSNELIGTPQSEQTTSVAPNTAKALWTKTQYLSNVDTWSKITKAEQAASDKAFSGLFPVRKYQSNNTLPLNRELAGANAADQSQKVGDQVASSNRASHDHPAAPMTRIQRRAERKREKKASKSQNPFENARPGSKPQKRASDSQNPFKIARPGSKPQKRASKSQNPFENARPGSKPQKRASDSQNPFENARPGSPRNPPLKSRRFTLMAWRGPKSINSREYSTSAASFHANCHDIEDRSCELSEKSCEIEVSSVKSTETQTLVEGVSTDERALCSDSDLVDESLPPLFWSHNSQQSPNGEKPIVHYCRSLRSTEETIQHFLGSRVIGFDMEWKSSASSWDSIQNNVSLIQIANEERIALFQVALFKPSRTLNELVPPSLKRLIESPEVLKVGVSIKADCTRLRKYLGIDAKATFELSHLFKLVKFGKDNPKLVNKRGVNLSDQMQEHFGLPLDKSEDVRCGDWARALTYQQVQYAATDPYACLRLFHAMEAKRQAMNPMPPRPAFAELGQPIVLPLGQAVVSEEQETTA